MTNNVLPPDVDPPSGYYLVTTGQVIRHDMVWNSVVQSWEEVAYNKIGTNVKEFYGVARKIGK